MRRHSSVQYPAVLAPPGEFAREMKRLDQAAAMPGLFDLPLPGSGIDGLTDPDARVVRNFYAIAQAFGLSEGALAEWQRVVARDEWPPLDGQLVRVPRAVLDGLLLRVRTVAYYHDADGKGPAWIRFWQRARRLDWQLGKIDAWDALCAQARDLAPPILYLLKLIETELPHGLASLSDLQRRLRAQGLTAGGWRWLVRYELPPLEFALDISQPMDAVVQIANAMAVLPPAVREDDSFRVDAALVAFYASLLDADLASRPWLLTSAWEFTQTLADDAERKGFLTGQFIEVGYWVIDNFWEPDANQRRAGWRAVMRAYQAAHDESIEPATWAVPVERVEKDGWAAVALSSTDELVLEGKTMAHCIANYAPQCVAGDLLVFSVRAPGGERVATFSLLATGAGLWCPHELRGRFNRKVTCPSVKALEKAAIEALEFAKIWQKP